MSSTPSPKILDYYSSPGAMTDPDKYSHLLEKIPVDIREICSLVQNNLLHVFWAERYGRVISEDEKLTLNLRPVARKFEVLHQTNSSPLTTPRSVDHRQIGNCRDFTVMLVSILRHLGVPARARCGFATYFLSNHYEDHWVCEYWNEFENRWVFVDAQLDEFQCDELNIDFDPIDVPRGQFIVAGKAWKMCRQGQTSPQQYGIFDMHGWWFIWGNVVRELLAINKIELLPWDVLPAIMTHELSDPLPTDPELAFYDGIAALTMAGDLAFPSLRAISELDPRFQVTPEIFN